MEKRNAYILTRLYFNDSSETGPFTTRFTRTVQSVVKNAKNYKDGKVKWILFDDSPNPDGHDVLIRGICTEQKSLVFGDDVDCNFELGGFFVSEKPGNSAYATFCVRKKFIDLTVNDKGAFAVSLDQDDELEPNAIKDIASKMTDKGIVLSPFTIINEGGKDITGDGGRIHKHLTKEISRHPIDNSKVSVEKPISKNDLTAPYYASSLSWSKSYSRFAMGRYVTLLEDFLSDHRKATSIDAYAKKHPVYPFYEAHPAYEDFVDFFALLLSEITISATSKNTHIYYKNADSITCNPSVDDFRLHRTASLLALIDLCYANQRILRIDFKSLLFRYVTIKVVDIERILSDYRKDFENGDRRFSDFDVATHNLYFISKLYRLAQGNERNNAQDKELFEKASPVRAECTKENFDDLFSCETLNRIPVYKSEITNADSRLVLESAVLAEDKFRPIGDSNKKTLKQIIKEIKLKIMRKKENEQERDIIQEYDNNLTPNQKRKRRILREIVSLIVLIILFIVITCWLICGECEGADFNKITELPSIITALTAFLSAFLTFLLNEFGKVEVLEQEEVAQKKMYFSEFDDLIRHLEANLKVMIELRKQLSEGEVPASIHFINLSWPNFSCLYSDDIAKILDKGKVDDFARLKVNLRNIENSSKWLCDYVKEPHSYEEISCAIDWEIARQIGYLMNFHYLKNNHFQFPSQNALDYYIKEKHLKEYLSRLFLSYSSTTETIDGKTYASRMEMVDKYLEMYYDDRRMRRSVLIYKKA